MRCAHVAALALTGLLLLTGCAPSKVPAEPNAASTAPNDTAATAPSDAEEEIVQSDGVWDEALLPDGFPAAFPVASALWTQYNPHAHLFGRDHEMWLLTAEMTMEQWHRLVDGFAAFGWSGGGTDLIATPSVEVDGAWVNAHYYAYVYHCRYTQETRLYTMQIAVVPRVAPSVNADWEALFVPFSAGYTHTGGQTFVNENAGIRQWRFGGSGRFCGVEKSAVQAYRDALTADGFTLRTVWDPQAEGDTQRMEATKTQSDCTLQVAWVYSPACRTLELTYTADFGAASESPPT